MKLRVLTALLFALAALGVSFHLDAYSPLHASEQRSEAIVAEMLRGGDWRMQGEKPSLYYRTVAAAAELSGWLGAVTLRGVSALAGFALLALVFAWGARTLDPATGLAAAAALCAMDHFWISARFGVPDMLLALFASAALIAFERMGSSREPRLLPVSVLFASLAFLTKPSDALVDVLVPIGVWLAAELRLAHALRARAPLWGVFAGFAGVAWFGVLLMRVPAVRAYLPQLLGATAPAVVLLPLVIHDAVRTRFFRDTGPLRFAATSALSLFVTWALFPQRGSHYFLAILPLFALLAGNALVRAARRP